MNRLYYMQDSRFFLGNTIVWLDWDGGYTADVRRARTYTKEECDQLILERPMDIPWPKEYIDKKTQPTVDFHHVERREAERAVKLIPLVLPKCANCDDVITEATCAGNNCDRWNQLQKNK